MPAIHVENFEEKDVTLGAWAGYIRQRFRKGQLSQERIDRISQISQWQWGPFQPGPATDSKRNEVIRNMRTEGKSLREIADEFDDGVEAFTWISEHAFQKYSKNWKFFSSSAAEPDFWRGSNGKWGHEVNSCDSESCVRVGRTRLGSVSCSACRERGR